LGGWVGIVVGAGVAVGSGVGVNVEVGLAVAVTVTVGGGGADVLAVSQPSNEQGAHTQSQQDHLGRCRRALSRFLRKHFSSFRLDDSTQIKKHQINERITSRSLI